VSKPDYHDPARLFDATSNTTEGVRAVLRSGQRGLPGPDELARLAARLPLGPLPPPTGAPPARPIASPRGLAPIAAPSVLPGVIVGAVLGLVVVAGWALRDAASSRRDDLVAATAVTNVAAPIAAPRAASPRPVDAPVELRDPARAPAIASSTPRGPAPPGTSVEMPQNEAPIAPATDAPAAAGSPPGPGVATETETEVHLLQRAQSALGADPGAALALTVEHARRFPGGALGQERELIAVTALVALGRRPEAQARAASLLERFPASAYRGRLESLGLAR
jgi:hypothetical protein